MSILNLQTRARELGRIRLGQVVATGNGKTRPEKIDRFRFTSYSRELLEQIAKLYGGTVAEWHPQGGGAAGFEVLTDAKRVPILVPPQPVSQWYETWSGGGCQKRCDGVTEVLSDSPCSCDPDPEDRECKPTTRLNVMLRDVPGLGVWRLESHGYYAAVELPAVAEFLARANGYIPASLVLEERTVKRDGQTRRYMVPAIEVEDVTPAQLMAGGVVGMQPGELSGREPAAIEAAPAPRWEELVACATTREELLGIREQAKAAVAAGQIEAAVIDGMLSARAQELGVSAERQVNPDELWSRILAAAPEGWTTADVEIDFEKVTSVDAAKATAADMQRYLNPVKV